MSNPISKKTDADIAQLKNKTVYSIPDNPSNKGFSAKQIKDKFAGPILEVAEWVKALSEETYDLGENINDIDEKCDDIVDGTLTAKKAEQDQSGNNIKATYGASLSHSLSGNDNSWTFIIKLLNKNGTEIDTETQVFGAASSSAAGLMTSTDKNKLGTIDTYAKSLAVSMDPSTYVITFALKDNNNNTLSTQYIDLPMESTVVNGSYNNTNKSLVLTLNSGSTIEIPIADIIDGLVSTTTQIAGVSIGSGIPAVDLYSGLFDITEVTIDED